MTTRHETMSAVAIKRQVIIESLEKFTEEDINDFSCPIGMTCAGISKKAGLSIPYVTNQARWLVRNGYIKKIGRRRMPGSKRQASNVLVLTDKGRKALNPVGQGASDLVRGHRGHEYDARAVHPERPAPVDVHK